MRGQRCITMATPHSSVLEPMKGGDNGGESAPPSISLAFSPDSELYLGTCKEVQYLDNHGL